MRLTERQDADANSNGDESNPVMGFEGFPKEKDAEDDRKNPLHFRKLRSDLHPLQSQLPPTIKHQG